MVHPKAGAEVGGICVTVPEKEKIMKETKNQKKT